MSAYVHDLQSAYQQLKCTSFSDSEFDPFCSVPHFRQVYQAWVIKIDKPFDFRCPVCEDEPHVLIGDATSESIQARHYCGQPITSFDADGPVAQRPHTRAERCLLSSASERKLLHSFAAHVGGDGKTAFGYAGLSVAHDFMVLHPCSVCQRLQASKI